MAELVTGPWDDLFRRDSRSAQEIAILAPFVTDRGAAFLTPRVKRDSPIRLITRLNEADFLSGVSHIEALFSLLNDGVRLRFQSQRLHAKMYIFDPASVIVSSGNLTKSGISENAEIGVRLSSEREVREALSHFEKVWESLEDDGTVEQLQEVSKRVSQLQLAGEGRVRLPPGVEDHGKEGYTGGRSSRVRPRRHRVQESNSQNFCKFLWRRDEPAPIETVVAEIATEQGAVAFPSHPGRPHQIHLNDHIYHTALTTSELGRDWRVFGRARVAVPHRPGVDEISRDLRDEIPEIADYPFCIWLCDCEFIDGTIGDGVSLHELFEELDDDTFTWSQERARQGDPHRHVEGIRYYRSHIQLTQPGADLLNARFDDQLESHGAIGIKSGDNIWWNRWIRRYDASRVFRKVTG